MIDKPEFPPLFQAGFHNVTLDDLKTICVENFSNNSKRQLLYENFLKFLDNLNYINSKFEIWIDGSFTTEKSEPEDIDILVIFDEAHINSLPSDQIGLINSLFDRELSKIRFNLDVLICEKENINMRSYWRGWFGFSRSEVVKGIAKLEYGN